MKGIPFVTLLDVTSRDSTEFGFVCEGPSMTKQSEADACDINKIMRGYEQTGLVPHGVSREGTFDDFPDAMEYQDALELARDASDRFLALPAKVRARFDNDPVKLLEFVSDEANRPEAQALGLLTVPPLPADPPAPVKPA